MEIDHDAFFEAVVTRKRRTLRWHVESQEKNRPFSPRTQHTPQVTSTRCKTERPSEPKCPRYNSRSDIKATITTILQATWTIHSSTKSEKSVSQYYHRTVIRHIHRAASSNLLYEAQSSLQMQHRTLYLSTKYWNSRARLASKLYFPTHSRHTHNINNAT